MTMRGNAIMSKIILWVVVAMFTCRSCHNMCGSRDSSRVRFTREIFCIFFVLTVDESNLLFYNRDSCTGDLYFSFCEII